MISELTAHLWQSTFFALAVALLTVAFRRNRARVRFWLWLTASLKFFIPFALLLSVGTQLAQKLEWETAPPVVSVAMEYVAQPFVFAPLPAQPAPHRTNWMPFAIVGVWLCGALTVLAIRARMWLRIRALLRASTPLEIPAAVEVRSAPGLLEPGVVGGIAWMRPILLLPEGILETLTPSQLEAVLAHELCHVRRRDNLFAAIQMIAEAAFWFHPLVWWIGARLVEERERACDEDVLTLGNEPRVYADAILNVCKLYAESPLVCVAGVTGSDIRARIEAIMTNRIGVTLNSARKLLLATAGFAAIAGPIAVGLLIGIGHLPAINAQSLPAVLAPIAQLAQSAPKSESPAPRLVMDNPIQLAQATPGGRGPAASPQSNPPANSGILKYADRRLIAMFFDLDGATTDEQSRARSAAENFVQNSLQPADLVTVMANSGGSVQVMQDFTADTAQLQATIQKVSAGATGSETASDRLAHLVTAAKMLAGFPQKKNLMYYSSATAGASQTEIQNAVSSVVQSNVAIFPISVNAVVPAPVDPSALPKPMARIYQRYGAPTQIEDRGTSKIWRYSYLEDFQGNAAFEYSTTGGLGVHMLYPPAAATFEGKAADPSVFASLAQALAEEAHGKGSAPGTVASPFPGTHTSAQVYPVVPGEAPSPDRRWVPLFIPVSSFSGAVDILVQVRARSADGTPGQMAGALRGQVQASVGTDQSGFTLKPGSWICYVVAQEKSTGHTFGEEIDIDAW
jgi:beta-lactamase regulating signal transducer with metallopeptidase domain